ncbi:bidirectional sugar transporter SWEET6b-like [Mangifera indica]|uniref:bidirectional sugar transporter SWEET6b-like n=1 Tax=Mangifera indica TaxID=29780 RepID=UPI001CFB3CC2|nr:bidirectional sugar transporter SWEET6b-like [Mangifera indica]
MVLTPHTARNIVGIIGNVISFGLFLSPAPTFWHIIKRKSVEEFQPYAYIATCLNCMFWILYGLPFVHPDSILVITINSVGLAMELLYLAIFCLHDRQKKAMRKVAIGLTGEVVFVAVVATITILAFHTHSSRSFFVGIICVVFSIMMYASPLTIVRKVIKTKSVEFMPFYLSLAGFVNGCIWSAYALFKLDYFLLISNGLGSILGLVQLIIYGIYYRSTPTKVQGNDKSTGSQLSAEAAA